MKKFLLLIGLLAAGSQPVIAGDVPYIPKSDCHELKMFFLGSPGGNIKDILPGSVTLMFPKPPSTSSQDRQFFVITPAIVQEINALKLLITVDNKKPKIDIPYKPDGEYGKLFNQNKHYSDTANCANVINRAIYCVAKKDSVGLKTLFDCLYYNQKCVIYDLEKAVGGPIFSTLVSAPGTADYMYDVLSAIGRKIPLVKNATYQNRPRILIFAGATLVALLIAIIKYKN